MAAVLDIETRNDVPSWLPGVADAIGTGGNPPRLTRIRSHDAHSNDIHELTFTDGRVLLLKRARHEWVSDCFRAAAEASRLIREHTDVIVPEPLPIERIDDELPVQAYWRIELPTLAQLWPALSRPARRSALRSLGALIRRLHGIAAPGWGPLHQTRPPQQVRAELERDLCSRLLPAVYAHWPEGLTSLETLIDEIGSVERLHGDRPALVHADLHLGNVLCRIENERVECVGLLDLDDACGGAPEADVAGFNVLHGPLFERIIDPALRGEVRTGYGEPLDQRLIDFYHCAHLANQGFSSALLEHHEHAAGVAAELKRHLG